MPTPIRSHPTTTAQDRLLAPRRSWPEYLERETLFDNAIRLRNLIWTIQKYAPAGSALLEAGFGSGKTSLMLSDLGYCVTGIDINQQLIETFRQRYADWVRPGRLDVLRGDIFDLPWRESCFDVAYHQGVLEHFSDEQIVLALSQQARVARMVIFDVPNSRGKDRDFGDERLLPPAHWRKLIQQSGLTLLEELGRGFRPWLYFLPYALFSHRALTRFRWLGAFAGTNSIFVCRSSP